MGDGEHFRVGVGIECRRQEHGGDAALDGADIAVLDAQRDWAADTFFLRDTISPAAITTVPLAEPSLP